MKPEITHAYQTFQRGLFETARAYKNYKRGKNWKKGYKLKLHPTEPDTVQLLQTYWVSTGGNHRRCPATLRPQHAVMTLRPNEILFHNTSQYECLHLPLTAECRTIFPKAEDVRLGPHTADNSYNLLLGCLTPAFRQFKPKDRHHPGRAWAILEPNTEPTIPPWSRDWKAKLAAEKVAIPFVGPVSWNALTGQFTPLWDQPIRVVDIPQRKHNTAAMRHAFLRLKGLRAVAGIEITKEDVATRLDELCPKWKVAETQMSETWKDPRAFIARAETFDPTCREDVIDLQIHAFFACPPPWSWYKNWDYYIAARPLNTEAGLRRVREALHKKLKVVSYEPPA